jgi:hypothetical protein
VRRQNEGSFGCEAVARVLGSQMCLNVGMVSVFFVFMQQKILYHSVVCFVFLQ